MAEYELGSTGDGRKPVLSATERKIAETNDHNDVADMRRLGKQQEFRRNFQFVSITAFSVITISGWVYMPSIVTTALANGGTGGVIVLYLVNFSGLFFVILSLAEMSSIAPTAGGQYHWSSEFAPPKLQKFISYISGWLSALAWLAGTAGGMYLVGLLMQALIVLTNPTYIPKAWQGYLFVVMISSFGLLVNTVLARALPKLEGVVFMLFTLSFLAIVVVLWVLSPRLTAAEVFTTFTKGDGWSTLGLSMLAVQSDVIFTLIGSDATAHMAEETKQASRIVPKAMIASYLINGALGFVMLITYTFTLVDYAALAKSPVGLVGFPFVQAFANSTGSVPGGAAMASILCVLQAFGATNFMASSARQIFAFARDKGLPFHNWIAKVDSAGTFPINAVFVVWAFIVLISLITLGSPIAFNAINSLTVLGLAFTYMLSISCLLWRRFFGARLPHSAWTLGRAGVPVNIVAVCYCIYLVIFLPFPVIVPATAENFNWASVMFAGIMFLSITYYVVWARKVYKGPVVYTRDRDE